ncbi:hypothetical protein pb186bvf_010488 [Paramecium bursaria]
MYLIDYKNHLLMKNCEYQLNQIQNQLITIKYQCDIQINKFLLKILQQNNMIVYVIGQTAAGKTKLSLNLGQDNYEIISCDSMQLYKQADLMTAKATPQQMAQIKHHGIDVLELWEEGFNRQKWRESNLYHFQIVTLNTIDDIHKRGKIPVLVGGTHYYIESILFEQEEDEKEQQIQQNEEVELHGKTPYEYLNKIDPITARKFHQNDIRRIMNQIKYYTNTGQLPSQKKDYHKDQQLRNRDFLILWPQWKSKELYYKFVQQRINEMIEDGGLKEIFKIFDILKDKPPVIGGVLQSIGYRQFKDLYDYFFELKVSLDEAKDDKTFQQLLEKSIDDLVKDTINYAKKQLQWIKNRFVFNHQYDVISKRLFHLRFDNPKSLQEQMIIPAQKIYKTFCDLYQNQTLDQIDYLNLEELTNYRFQLCDKDLENQKQLQEQKQRENWKKYFCEFCKKENNGPYEQQQHLKSKLHRKNTQNLNQQKQGQNNNKKQKQEEEMDEIFNLFE